MEDTATAALKAWAWGVVRTGVAAFMVLLIRHGLITQDQVTNEQIGQVASGIVGILVVLGHNFYQKYQAKKIIDAALLLPANSKYETAKEFAGVGKSADS